MSISNLPDASAITAMMGNIGERRIGVYQVHLSRGGMQSSDSLHTWELWSGLSATTLVLKDVRDMWSMSLTVANACRTAEEVKALIASLHAATHEVWIVAIGENGNSVILDHAKN